MKFLLLLAAIPLYGQLTLTSDGPATPGSTAAFTLTLGPEASVAALEFAVSLPAGIFPPAVNVTGTAAAAGKTFACVAATAALACVLSGPNQTVIQAGTIATITATVAPTARADMSFPVAFALGATAAGDGVGLTKGPPALLLVKSSKCDTNGDFAIDTQDLNAVIVQALQWVINEVTGSTGGPACTTGDVSGNGKCDIEDVQRVRNAIAGGVCR